MRLSGTGFTEAEAKAKRCWRDVSSKCAASACMGWEFGIVQVQSIGVDLPDDVIAAFNATGTPIEGGEDGQLEFDVSPVRLWIEAEVTARTADGWKLHDDSTPEQQISDLYDCNMFDQALEAGDVSLTFERPRAGAVPRGDCLVRHAGRY